MMKKQIFLGFLILGLAIIMPVNSYGAEDNSVNANIPSDSSSEIESENISVTNEDVLLDENITSEDLEISEPSVLPSNPFYFFKNSLRGIKSALTFNPVKKAELKLRFADERLIEAKKMAESLENSEKASELVEKAIEKYEQETEKIKNRIEKFENIEKEKIEKFVERFTDHQIKQQKLIDRIENKLTEKGIAPEKIESIIKHKQKAMENFANGVLKVVNPEELKNKLEKVMEEAKGSDFKHFKNLEILENLEERIPDEAREAIKQAQENAVKRLHNVLGSDEEKRERFKNFIENSGGDELRKLKIIEDIDIDNFNPNIKRVLEEARTKTLDMVRDRIENIQNEEQKEKIFKRLEKGQIDNIQVIDRLKNILPEEAKERLIEVKQRAIENLENNIENINLPEEKQRALKEIKQIKDINILNRIKSKIENDVLKPNLNNNLQNEQKSIDFNSKIDRATDIINNAKEKFPDNFNSAKEKINEKGIFNEVEKRKIELEKVKDSARESMGNVRNIKDILIEKTDALKEKVEDN